MSTMISRSIPLTFCQKGAFHWSLAGEFAGVELGDRNRALESGGLERALGISIMVNND